MTRGNLILHCGGEDISHDDLIKVPTPDETKTFCPMPHHAIATMAREVIEAQGFAKLQFDHWQFGISHEGQRMFGVIRYRDPDVDNIAFAVGIRNAHDKKFSAALAMGSQVFVCDNLCFNGEVMLMQRHHQDPLATMRRQLAGYFVEQGRSHFDEFVGNYGAMKEVILSQAGGYRLIGQALGQQILTATVANACMREWDQPTYTDFTDLNLWSLYNAGTLCLKRLPIGVQFEKLKAWNNLMLGEGIRLASEWQGR